MRSIITLVRRFLNARLRWAREPGQGTLAYNKNLFARAREPGQGTLAYIKDHFASHETRINAHRKASAGNDPNATWT
ncbi:MAG: hypothetical protein NT172_21140 [Planctomycetota bacterium]|nr:hypothetical protein [Planctomycetota bacterium]